MSSIEDTASIVTAQINVGTSGGGFYVGITGGVGVNSQILKMFSGGTCIVYGDTVSAAGASTLFGYVMSAGEALNLGGPTPYYLTSSGATSVLMLIKTRTSGN